MDPENLNGSIGWVSLSEVRNVFVEYIKALDKQVWPEHGRALRGEVMKHFESAQYELMKRAKKNYIEYTKSAPASILPARPQGPESKLAREKRLNTMARRPGDGS